MDNSTNKSDGRSLENNDEREVVFTSDVRQEPIDAELVDAEPVDEKSKSHQQAGLIASDLDSVRPDKSTGERAASATVDSMETLKTIFTVSPPNFVNRENLAAMGGTVGSLVLGMIALLGSMISAYASITAVIGIVMGIWGLNSTRKTWAIIGIGMCIAGFLFAIGSRSTFLLR